VYDMLQKTRLSHWKVCNQCYSNYVPNYVSPNLQMCREIYGNTSLLHYTSGLVCLGWKSLRSPVVDEQLNQKNFLSFHFLYFSVGQSSRKISSHTINWKKSLNIKNFHWKSAKQNIETSRQVPHPITLKLVLFVFISLLIF
jgi:hypothetical protein